ncbi:MAG: asparagine synthase-related protein, partial [Spirochaetota bacterium]
FSAPAASAVADELVSTLPAEFPRWHPLERAQYLEARTLLPGYILAPQGDRMLMGHSVEGRFPFLDHRVVEFACSLPPEQKLTGELDEKHILKRAFADLIPEEVRTRPKQPYRAPDAASFFAGGSSPDWLPDLLAEDYVANAGIFNPGVVQGLARKCRSHGGAGMSNTDNMRIVAVISTMLLHARFIAGDAAIARARRDGASVPVERVSSSDAHAAS